MVAQLKDTSPALEKIGHCARKWRHTEKQAIAAAPGEKSQADRAHHQAKKELREAVDVAERSQS
jgi:hypothetical protein